MKKRKKFLNLFQRSFLEKKLVVLAYCLSVVLFLWLYIALFPSFQNSVGSLNEYIKSLPEGFLKAFGFEMDSFSSFEGYIASEQFSFIWPFMVIALSVSLATAYFAGEIEKGTIEILLSQPISRVRIFLEKTLAGIFSLSVFIFVSFFAVFPIAEAYNIEYKTGAFLKLSLIGFLFGLAIFGLSLFFSSLFSERSKAIFIVVGILILMYVLNIVSGLKENLDKLKYLSFFYYFKPPDVLVHNKIDSLSWWVFGGVFLISLIFALICFNRRDVAV